METRPHGDKAAWSQGHMQTYESKQLRRLCPQADPESCWPDLPTHVHAMATWHDVPQTTYWRTLFGADSHTAGQPRGRLSSALASQPASSAAPQWRRYQWDARLSC